MDKIFDQKVMAVTDAASGIGKATAKILASRSASVSICDINLTALEQVAAEITKKGGKVISTVVDIRDDTEVVQWIEKTIQQYGKLHGVANIAGVAPRKFGLDRVEEMDEEDWDFTLDVNLTGLMHCLRAQIKAISHPGAIVNTSSIMGLVVMNRNVAYCASKHAVIGLSKAARDSTDIAEDVLVPRGSLKRVAEPREVAEAIVWLLSDASSHVTGTVQVVDSGWMH